MEIVRQIEERSSDPYWQEVWSSPASSISSKLDQVCQEKIRCQHELLAKVAAHSSEY
jgi:hypothetical protein